MTAKTKAAPKTKAQRGFKLYQVLRTREKMRSVGGHMIPAGTRVKALTMGKTGDVKGMARVKVEDWEISPITLNGSRIVGKHTAFAKTQAGRPS